MSASSKSRNFVTLPSGYKVYSELRYSPSVLTGLPKGTKFDKRDLNAGRAATATLVVQNYGRISVSCTYEQCTFDRAIARRDVACGMLDKLRTLYSTYDFTNEVSVTKPVFSRADRRIIFQLFCGDYGTEALDDVRVQSLAGSADKAPCGCGSTGCCYPNGGLENSSSKLVESAEKQYEPQSRTVYLY